MTKTICNKCKKTIFNEPDNAGKYYCEACGVISKSQIKEVNSNQIHKYTENLTTLHENLVTLDEEKNKLEERLEEIKSETGKLADKIENLEGAINANI